jgi:hypothetical protein
LAFLSPLRFQNTLYDPKGVKPGNALFSRMIETLRHVPIKSLNPFERALNEKSQRPMLWDFMPRKENEP